LLEVGWQEIAICAITVAELYYGAYNSSRISENLDRATKFIQQVPVLQFTDLALQRFGQFKAELRQQGQPVTDFDLAIASIALANNLIVVTNNTRHYARIPGLQLENWMVR
jgi:tRNA(fMet)-specific endonuclease VapC